MKPKTCVTEKDISPQHPTNPTNRWVAGLLWMPRYFEGDHADFKTDLDGGHTLCSTAPCPFRSTVADRFHR